MKKKILYLILFLILPQLLLAQEDYLLPLKENRGLSSVFADHRDFHFHSGIDFKTGGKSGFEVYATKSGWVYRLFTSWWGYGKAVYLKHPDGKLTVYAHLSDFSEKLKKLVTEKQFQNRRYKVDIFLSEFGSNRRSTGEDTIPEWIRSDWIEQGEVIGYSGQTGSGGPHLHFEIRDEKNRPLNPLSHCFSIPDSIAPRLQSIILRPLDLNSYVDGSMDFKIYPLYFDSTEKIFSLRKIPIVEGKIGVELSAYDKMEEKGSKFGVYKLELFLDDLLVFSSHYDTIDFENSWKVELDRDFELLHKGEGEFYKLYLDYGNDLPLYYSFNRGILDFTEDKLHQLTIQAEDAYGNISRAKFFLRVEKRPSLVEMFLKKNERGYVIGGKVKDNKAVRKISVEASSLEKIFWKNLSWTESNKPLDEFRVQVGDLDEEPKILRVKGVDDFGAESDYLYLLHGLDKVEKKTKKGKAYPVSRCIRKIEYFLKDSFWIFKVSFSQILKNKPEVFLKSGELKVFPLSQKQIDEKNYQFIFPLFELSHSGAILHIQAVDIYGIEAGGVKYIDMFIAKENGKAVAESVDGVARVEIDSGSVFKRINLRVKKLETPEKARQKLKSPLYSFYPSDLPLAKPAKISLSCKRENCQLSKTGLYEYRDNTYEFIGQEIDTLYNLISGRVRHLSSYALLEDLKPPEIKKVYPKSGRRVKGEKLIISAWVEDDLSGIGSDLDIELFLDGEWLIPEYDPERFILVSKPFKILSPGWHELIIKAKDRMGNEKEVKSKFKVIM